MSSSQSITVITRMIIVLLWKVALKRGLSFRSLWLSHPEWVALHVGFTGSEMLEYSACGVL